jgi:DNA-nicking Smr family endonuclease
MPPRARGLSEADQAIWETYAQQLSPLRGRIPKSQSPKPAPQTPPPKPASPKVPLAAKPRTATTPLAVGTHPGGLDKATWHRFQSGKLATARTLDLHGMTA